ncbi:hypothetical protein HMPREF1981_00156 [Bacteroides pyogenes F0041]|uniref:Uncharacterized protein n=1 Tax=Bacteroides pyogenes F0041 TaxID=1321819 RepID=U2CWM3_9BACE|nr:hypothetical protein HMPREF1981_00156 [Bacteroides pyogenes F0041]
MEKPEDKPSKLQSDRYLLEICYTASFLCLTRIRKRAIFANR